MSECCGILNLFTSISQYTILILQDPVAEGMAASETKEIQESGKDGNKEEEVASKR